MGLGQIQLVVGALVILSTLQLSINSSILRSYITSWDSEATIDAISIGEAMVDEVSTKAFDEETIDKKVYNADSLTADYYFGPDTPDEFVTADEREPFESASKFDDVDDYQGYTRLATSLRLGDFTIRDSIIYVRNTNQDSLSATQSWYKKIVVIVNHPKLLSPVIVKGLSVYRRYF
ncbi:MAG TPA: hypothetical protein VFF29_01085 [Bacteroidota bacterium]|nr:hypothetical protein [Bacteroidota bacterium]